jgi:hypothetical protein
LAIVEKETKTIVGDCGLHCPLDDPRQMEVGITLAPSHQGRATEALGCLLDFVFGSLDKHRISAVTGVQNHARCPCSSGWTSDKKVSTGLLSIIPAGMRYRLVKMNERD